MARINDSDLSIMMALHDAFRRDSVRLARAAARHSASDDPATRAALLTGWRLFSAQLHQHHSEEDKHIWPRMRAKLAGKQYGLDLLDSMEAEHGQVDPALAAVEASLGTDAFAGTVDNLVTLLTSHLAHEERDTIPLIKETLTSSEWQTIGSGIRSDRGFADAGVALPWMLDEATPERTAAVLGEIPAPLRLLYRYSWLPRYQRTRRWS